VCEPSIGFQRWIMVPKRYLRKVPAGSPFDTRVPPHRSHIVIYHGWLNNSELIHVSSLYCATHTLTLNVLENREQVCFLTTANPREHSMVPHQPHSLLATNHPRPLRCQIAPFVLYQNVARAYCCTKQSSESPPEE
jgi:hypothetical protein